MNNTYLVRAKLENGGFFFGSQPKELPIALGPFTIDISPNLELYLQEMGWVESSSKELPPIDMDYPLATVYIETQIEVPVGASYYQIAEDTLVHLEILFRLFQPGYVYIRCARVWRVNEKEGMSNLLLSDIEYMTKGSRPEPIVWYLRHGYDISDEKLAEFTKFFDRYYEMLQKKSAPLHVAVNGFSSSYEKRTLADRLIDLMIAMEALLGSQTEVTYKIALRFACLLYPPGEARESFQDC